MLTSLSLNEKSREVHHKAISILALLAFIDQVTERTMVAGLWAQVSTWGQ